MPFTIRSTVTSPLLFTREQAILREALPNGIISGMQAHRGSGGGFNVDFLAGIFVINGIGSAPSKRENASDATPTLASTVTPPAPSAFSIVR